jgi:hypothetical protein
MRLRYSKYSVTRGLQRLKTRTAVVLAVTGLAVGGGGGLSLLSSARADTLGNINFESPAYTLGNINGQNGWVKTGSYDAAVTANTYGYTAFGGQSLRISNAVTSGSFGDQTFSPSLANEAGEADALNGGFSGGTRQPHFEAQFDLASTTKAEQPGMVMSVSPDRGDGARMSYLRFVDQADGIHVFFDDVTDPSHATNADNFNESDIATLSYATSHTIKFSIDFVNGPDNDVVRVNIDGSLAKTGTTWEDYYRFDTESNPTLANNSRTVDSLLFREGGTAVAANAGNGYLVDNLSLLSGPIVAPVTLPKTKDQCMNNGWKTFGATFKNQGDCVSFVATKGKNQPTNQPVAPVVSLLANGNVTLSNPTQSLAFTLSDNGPTSSDVGSVSYSNSDPSALGLHYTVPATCVNVFGNTAYFAYQIPSTAPVAANVLVVWKVVDNGASDTAGFTTAPDMASASALCEAGDAAVTNYAVTSGDITVL